MAAIRETHNSICHPYIYTYICISWLNENENAFRLSILHFALQIWRKAVKALAGRGSWRQRAMEKAKTALGVKPWELGKGRGGAETFWCIVRTLGGWWVLGKSCYGSSFMIANINYPCWDHWHWTASVWSLVWKGERAGLIFFWLYCICQGKPHAGLSHILLKRLE